MMTIEETNALLRHLDDALKTMERSEGRLGAAEISAKSMLTVIRNQLREMHHARCQGVRPE